MNLRGTLGKLIDKMNVGESDGSHVGIIKLECNAQQSTDHPTLAHFNHLTKLFGTRG